MIVLANASEKDTHQSLFEQMYKLRARVFGTRRKWSVDVTDGIEKDYFDNLDPLYIMVVTPRMELLASLRLLQTTGPHMLADVFPETLAGATLIRHPLVWESTRFCVDTEAVTSHASNGVNLITSELLWGLFSTAYDAGLTHIVSVYDLYLERILRRAGCKFDRLGEPFAYDGLKTVAGVFEVSPRVIEAIRSKMIDSETGDAIQPEQPGRKYA